MIAVIRAERSRLAAGAVVTRRAWKNLVFTGGPGSGKSRAAGEVARAYRELGVLSSGHLTEVAALDLIASDSQQTGLLVREAASRGRGGILMITGAHAYAIHGDQEQQVLRCLHEVLAEFRDDLAVILAGDALPLRELLQASPSLADRFPAIVDFPGYDVDQLTAIFNVLAGEAGFSLAPGAARRAADSLRWEARAADGGNARLAVRLLSQAITRQARRIAAVSGPVPDDELCTLRAEDIPGISPVSPDTSSAQPDPPDHPADRPPGQCP